LCVIHKVVVRLGQVGQLDVGGATLHLEVGTHALDRVLLCGELALAERGRGLLLRSLLSLRSRFLWLQVQIRIWILQWIPKRLMKQELGIVIIDRRLVGSCPDSIYMVIPFR